ncbi:ABC transporter permease [Cryobacterium sp. Sr8]|uniref:Monosaccharide ABC transporter membrane protein, CUT2 family n=1 Tax=Cryobacterium psychrotolerans TaxID=386301 RepID=A0A1G9H7B8_9MICO|nr:MULTISPECIES: ABC transporter permease [Cryobacterium]TFD44708.1 ABC transporter permease [Cryobacterium sp. TMT1-2-1]TFD82624.1 ABC transporter permease [Cryobacterium sp. Sr8]TFD83479.1 ABC transporter permease [Cryobacterium psychrotolerans]SDL08293.1 monosaccharide ABC transporter membrane protein, CUT2 family [Cryobacterium psychrotolerans]
MTSNGEIVKQETHGASSTNQLAPAIARTTLGQKTRKTLRKIVTARESTLAAVVILLVVYLSWASPYFFTAGNLTVVGRQIGLALIISVGMTFVILIGGIDLSVGSVVAFVSVLTGVFIVNLGISPIVAVLLALVGGAVVGLVNGSINAFMGIPSFVVTLGMLAVARGLSLGITSGSTISGFPSEFLFIGQGAYLGIPIPVWVAAIVAIAAHLVLTRTTFGRHVYFVGSNEEAAKLSGIRVRRVKISVFVIASTLAAVSGILETARLSVGQPAAGNGYELLAIGAAVIGGASLFGGVGGILGTALGTSLLLLIQNALILLGISAYWQQVFSGVIIVGAVALNMWRKQRN